MAKLPFDKAFAHEVIKYFSSSMLELMWCGCSRKNVNIMHDLLDDPDKSGSLLEAAYHFAETGEWTGGAPDEELPIFSDLFGFEMPEYLSLDDRRHEIQAIHDFLTIRWAIDPIKGVYVNFTTGHYSSEHSTGLISRNQLAQYEGVKEDTIRAAMYGSDNTCLKPVKDDLYHPEDVKRWQIARGTFQPTRIKNNWALDSNGVFRSTSWFRRWLENFTDEQYSDPVITFEQIRNAVSPEAQDSFDYFWRHGSDSNERVLQWFTSDVAIELGTLLHVSPRLMAKHVFALRDEIRREKEVAGLPTDSDFKSLFEKKTVSNTPDSQPATADIIRMILQQAENIEVHDLQKGKKNAKMDGYQANGVTFTHEHSLKKQFIWVPENIGKKLNLEKSFYSKDQLDQKGRYGRHSGLKKYSEIAYESLYKIHIRSCGELRSLLKVIS
ncbi:hypothetical protein [Spongorhabdus nitratireducens]